VISGRIEPSDATGRYAPRRLAAGLGSGAIALMVLAAAAPLAVVAGTVPVGIAAGNGAAYPGSYVVCTAVLLMFSVGFTTMARHVPRAGAFFTYIAYGLGRHIGLGAAFLALVSYTAIQGAVSGYIGASINNVVTSHGGPQLPWYAYALVMMVAVSTLGYRNIKQSGKVLGVLMFCEIAIVAVIDAAVISRGGANGLSTAAIHPGNFFAGAPGIALIFAISGYIGFEATVVFRDEVRDPEHTLPRATYLAVLFIGAFYAVASWAIVTAWGDGGAVKLATTNPTGMITETATRYVGFVAGDLVQILVITSLFAALLSFHNVLARYIFTLGNAAALPSWCGRSHVEHASPHIASVVQTGSALVLIVASALAGLDPVTEVFTWLAAISSVGVLALMTLASIAVVVYFRRTRFSSKIWHTLLAPVLSVVGLTVLLVMTALNLPLLVGGSTTVATLMGALLVAAFASGAAVGVYQPHAGRDYKPI